MSRYERSGVRDLTYSRWHRTLDDDQTYIDIDGCEYCRGCNEPLALIETSEDHGQHKTSTVTRNLAKMAGLPAYLVMYFVDETGELKGASVKGLTPNPSDFLVFTAEQLGAFIKGLRVQHTCKWMFE